MITIETLKKLQTIKDIDNLSFSENEKAEVFFTALYIYYRKMNLNMKNTQATVKMVHKLANKNKDENENVPYIIGNVFVKVNLSKWCINGEKLFSILKKSKQLNNIPILKAFKY